MISSSFAPFCFQKPPHVSLDRSALCAPWVLSCKGNVMMFLSLQSWHGGCRASWSLVTGQTRSVCKIAISHICAAPLRAGIKQESIAEALVLASWRWKNCCRVRGLKRKVWAPLILLLESGSQIRARRKESLLLLFKLKHSYHEKWNIERAKQLSLQWFFESCSFLYNVLRE